MTSIENKSGYKSTKLGWIPEDWELQSIGEVSTKVGSGSTPRGGKSVYLNEGIPFIRSQNVNRDQLLLDDVVYISQGIHERMIFSEVKPNDILLNITGASIGRSCVVPLDFKRGNVNQHVCIIRLKSKFSPKYLQAFLSSYKGQITILRNQVGGNREGLNHSSVRRITFPLPSLPEQQKIATILSTWDKAIDNLSDLIDAKEEQKKGLMQRLLTGKVRLKGFHQVWRTMKLGEVFEERRETGNTGLELLSIGSKGVYPQSESNKKDTSNNNKDKYKRICKGDIGYNTMRMWQGRSAISTLEGIVSPAYTIVTPKEGHHVRFYGYLFHTPDLIHRFWRYSQGLVGDTLNCKFKNFSKVKALVPPPIEEQKEIATVLDQISLEIKTLEKKRDIYELEKKGLMQQLLTGKIRVKV